MSISRNQSPRAGNEPNAPGARPRPANGARGFTLAEVVIAIALGTMLVLVIASLSVYGTRSFACMANYLDLQKDSRLALDRMTRDIRQARALTFFATNQLVFEDFDTNALTFTYSPVTKTLTKTKGDLTQVLLEQCDYLQFSMFQRNPLPGDMNFVPATEPEDCKLIEIQWECSRLITGSSLNTLWVQTAKVVIRKKRG